MLPSQFARLVTKQVPHALNYVRAFSDKQLHSFTMKIMVLAPASQNPIKDTHEIAKIASDAVMASMDSAFTNQSTETKTTDYLGCIIPDNDQ